MLYIQPAIDLPRLRGSRRVAYAALAVLILSLNLPSVQTRSGTGVLDLTTTSPAGEQGYPGIPGMNVGGSTGPALSADSLAYPLPLELSILRSSFDNEGHFVVEVLLRNIGQTTFRLPSSRNLTKIEKIGNKSQRIFFFLLRPDTREGSRPEFITAVATGGSTSVSASLIDLGPGESLRVLVPATADELRSAFAEKTKELEARVICHEWQLEDDRYFIRARSNDVASKNTIKVIMRDGGLVPVQQ